jgi:1,4-dihydroxy-6-naphthoate synthase
MSEEVMRKHIELYVNDYTTNLGVEGEKAVVTLFNEAKKTGLVKETDLPPSIFY